MSKKLAQGFLTITNMYETAMVKLTNEIVAIPCDSYGAPKLDAYLGASTFIEVFRGNDRVYTSDILIGDLILSSGTQAETVMNKVMITSVKDMSGYVDIPVDINTSEGRKHLGTYRFGYVKQLDGIEAQSISIVGEQVFKYTDDFQKGPNPEAIYLSAVTQNMHNPTFEWFYKKITNGNEQWVLIGETNYGAAISAADGSPITDKDSKRLYTSSGTIEISPNNDTMWGGSKTLQIKCIANRKLYDEFTVYKVSDGKSGDDAYTVMLTNENHSFPSDSSGNISEAKTVTTNVVAYKGTSPAVISSITIPSSKPQGLDISVSGNMITVTALKGSSLSENGTFNIGVSIEGKTFNKVFSWSKIKQGSTGTDGKPGVDGKPGEASKYIIVSGQQVFKKPKGTSDYAPSSISLTAQRFNMENDPSGQWYITVNSNRKNLTTSSSQIIYPSDIPDPYPFGIVGYEVITRLASGKEVRIVDEVTIVKLADGSDGASPIVMLLTNENHSIPAGPNGEVSQSDLLNAKTDIKVFEGTREVTSNWAFSILSSSSGLEGSISRGSSGVVTYSVTKFSTGVTSGTAKIKATRSGYSDITKEFSITKSLKGQDGKPGTDGKPGVDGTPGVSYTLNIIGGARGIAYSAIGDNPSPSTTGAYSVELLRNGERIEPNSYKWSYGGSIEPIPGVTQTDKSTFSAKPTNNIVTDEATFISVSVKPTKDEDPITHTIPIVCTKHADGLDWIKDWDGTKAVVDGEKVLAAKIYAGSVSAAGKLNGVAIGTEAIMDNSKKRVGIVGYKSNVPTFLLDTDGKFLLSTSGNSGEVVKGTKTGLYFDGTNLSITGNVAIKGGSIGGSGITDIVNGANAGTDAKNDLDNLQIGGRNLWIDSRVTGYSAIEELEDNHITGQKKCYKLNSGANMVFNIEPDFSPRLYGKVSFSAWVKYTNVVTGDNSWNKFNLFKHTLYRKNSDTGATSSGADYLTLAGYTGTSDWKKVIFTHDYSSVSQYDQLKTSLKFNLEGTKSGTAWITGIKVELGNRTTDWTPAPEDVVQAIDNKVDNKQDAIFNKLFGDGTQGFVLEGGKVYINGEVIKANAISGNTIKAGTLTADKLTVSGGTTSEGNLVAGKSLTGSGSGTTATDGLKAVGSAYQSFGSGSSNNNAAESAYIQVDLGSSKIISESRIYFYSQEARSYWYKIKYSTDNTNWFYATGRSGNNGWINSPKPRILSAGSENATINKFSPAIVARYVRIYANGNTANTGNHIYEWELYSQANTQISGSEIVTGTLNAGLVNVTNLNASNISTGSLSADRMNVKGLLVKNSANETTLAIDGNGNVSMRGSMTITGGSVPSSILSGTIDNARLNSSIVTGASNGTSAKGTLDSNSANWSNAYDRVVQWASGAVSGNTTINGGLIATNTITAEKIAVGDFNNYSQLAKGKTLTNMHGSFTWTGSEEHYYWATDTNYAPFTVDGTKNPFTNGDEVVFDFELYAATAKDGVSIGVWFYSGDNGSGYLASNTVDFNIKTGWNRYRISVPINSPKVVYAKTVAIMISNQTHRIEVRNVIINRKLRGEFIVDGTITANKLNVTDLTAFGATIGGFSIKDGAIYSTNVGMGRDGKDWAFWAGGDTSGSAPFRVGHSGEVVASNMTITGGNITLNNGSMLLGNTSGSSYMHWTGSQLWVKAAGMSIGTEDVATKSFVTTTADDITFKFSSSGGGNLLKNSGWRTENLELWGLHQHNNPNGECNLRQTGYQWAFPDPSVNTVELKMSNKSAVEWGISQDIECVPGKRYTISFCCAGHRVWGGQILVRNPDSSWLHWLDFNPEAHGSYNLSDWKTITTTFTATQRTHKVQFILTGANNDGYMWIARPMVNEGEVALPYAPFDREVYEGCTRIDGTGVTIYNGAITIKNKSNQDVLKGDTDGNITYSGKITGAIADFKDTVYINGSSGWAHLQLKSREGLVGQLYANQQYGVNLYSPNEFYIGGKWGAINSEDNGSLRFRDTETQHYGKEVHIHPRLTKVLGSGGILYLESNAGVVQSNNSLVVAGMCRPTGNGVGGQDLGAGGYRWYTAYTVTALNTSDKKYKKNIEYVDHHPTRLITNTPYLDFIKNDLKVAEFDYIRKKVVKAKGEELELIVEEDTQPQDHQIGFVAQDIINTDIGSKFCYDIDGGMAFSPAGYTTVVAKALQEANKKIEILEDRISRMEKLLEGS